MSAVRLADLPPAGRAIVLALLEAERANHLVDAIVSTSAAGDARTAGPEARPSAPGRSPTRRRAA